MTATEKEGIVISGLDVFDILRIMDKKKNKYLHIGLTDLEELGIDPEVWQRIRKTFLDTFGDYTRSLSRTLLGDVEIPPYHG